MPRRKAPIMSSLNVLFIGNSFTARNNLPDLIARIAQANGATFKHQLLSIGGASLRTHWNRGEAQKEIERGGYDYVVLQEQSTLPIKNHARMRENVLLFDEVIRRAGSRTVLYMTWARQNAPASQKAITDAYTSIGEEIGALVIPVGIAWKKALRRGSCPALYDKDGSHPTLAGSYLAACVAFSALFPRRKLKAQPQVDGLDSDEMKQFQQQAGRLAT